MTIYWARVRYTLTGNESRLEYESAIGLEMALSLLTNYVKVLDEGTARRSPAGSTTHITFHDQRPPTVH